MNSYQGALRAPHQPTTFTLILAAAVGASTVRRATPEFVREHTGQPIGGVAPVGHPKPVTTLIDTWLAKHEQVWAAAGHPHTVFPTTYDELIARGLQTLPTNLLAATLELEADDVLREALGRGRDEDYVDYYIRVKRDEWNRYHEQVTPWEIREYLTRF